MWRFENSNCLTIFFAVEDCWRQSLSSLGDFERNDSEVERDEAPDDDSEKPLDKNNERKVLGCDNVDQIQSEIAAKGTKIGPEQVLIGSFKRRVRFRMNSDDETLSTEEDSLQCISSLSSDTTGRSSVTEIAETSETRRPGPPTIDTQIQYRAVVAQATTNELQSPESPMGAILSSALLHKGHAGISLALASDILASQIYSQQGLLPHWLKKQLGDSVGPRRFAFLEKEPKPWGPSSPELIASYPKIHFADAPSTSIAWFQVLY
jgi:hypothetical protein